jgi:hypothetical protein
MNEDYQRFIVTSDPGKLAVLQPKADELDSFALGDLAMSLGLYPPDYVEGERQAITLYGPPGHEGPPLLVWSVGLWSPDPDDLVEEDDGEDDNDALWGAIGIRVVNPNEHNTDRKSPEGNELGLQAATANPESSVLIRR